MNFQELASVVSKIQRRMPARIAGLQGWAVSRDSLYARHWLADDRRRELDQALVTCRTHRDYFDFASRFFPAHQIPFEILSFLELAESIQPKTVVEIGTAEGGTNFLLGSALSTVTQKVAVDLFVRNTRLLKTFGRSECQQQFVNGSSYDPQTVRRVREILHERPIDVLFIDGDHRYDGAKADFNLYSPMVRSGGLIAFHDIVPDFKTRFGRDTGRWAGDVPKLWQEVKQGYAQTWEFVENREQDGLGIGVVQAP